MKNCDLNYVMELIFSYIVLSQFGSLDTAPTGDCPPGQVLHINPENNTGLCCIPVRIQRGYEAVPCSVDGTEDGFQKCQNGAHQPDDTSSHHMPECIVDPQCTNEGIKKDYTCIDEYCWPVCICSLEHGKCGLDPIDCTDIKKITCPSKVLPNCSCAPPDITSTLPASSSSTVKPISLESSVPTPTNESWIDSTKIIDKFDTTEDGTDKENKWKIPVSIGCAFLVLVVVVVVVLYIYCRRRKDNILMQNGDSQENDQNTAEIEMEKQRMLPSDLLVTGHAEPTEHEEETQQILSMVSGQDESVRHEVPVHAQPFSSEDLLVTGHAEPTEHEEETQQILSWKSGQHESVGHKVEAQPFSPEDSEESGQSQPIGHVEGGQATLSEGLPHGAQLNSFEVPNMSNLPDIWSPFSSSLFHSHANTTDQQEVSDESERDQTHAKSVVSSANLNQEEEHLNVGVTMPNMSNLPDIGSPFSSSLFHSHANTTDQQEVSDESERDQTHAKSVVSSANLNQEEEHLNVGVTSLSEFGLSSNGLWSDFSLLGTECNIQQAVSDIPQAGCDIPQAGCDIPQAVSNIPQVGSDIQQAGSDIPQAGSDIPQAGCDIPQTGSDIPQAGCDIPQAVSNMPQAGSDIPQAGSDIPQAGCDIPQAVSNIPQAGSDIPQAVSDIPQAGCAIPQAGSDIPHAGSDIQQAVSDIAQAQSVSQRES